MTREFIRLGAHDTPEAAIDEAKKRGGKKRPKLHGCESAPVVGSVEVTDAYREFLNTKRGHIGTGTNGRERR